MRFNLEQKLKDWFIAPSSGLHLDLADGLRGLAILMVVCDHGFYYNPTGPHALISLGKLITTGWMGVPIFFVLSGLLISLPFFKKRETDANHWCSPAYPSRRFLKIIPPFYLVILLLAIYYVWHYHDLEYVKLGAAWATGVAHVVQFSKYFNTSFWSLWVEVGFYIALPFLFLALRGLKPKTTGWVIFCILMAAAWVERQLVWNNALNQERLSFLTDRFPGRLDNFAWGVLFAAYYATMSQEPRRWRRLGVLGYAGLGLLAINCFLFSRTPDWVQSGNLSLRFQCEMFHLLPPLSAFLLLFFAFAPQALGSRLFASPAFRFLGVVSYEWFLIHQPAQTQFREWMGSSQGHFGRYLATVIAPTLLSLVLAVVLYRTYSLPILRWGRKQTAETRPPHKVTVPAGQA